ncbi:MAG: hypothetical protein Q8K65_05675 [Alphaproteobacteria bacterium]|nr:hypothetical protein [Alphaproteobacteria bacterium]
MTEIQEKEPQTTTPLAALTGKLGSSFAAASEVTRLHREIVGSQPEISRDQTGAALNAFYAAAEKLKSREAEFTARRRTIDTGADATPDLKINLRSAEHFAALRAFKGASADIVALDPARGSELVKAVEKTITPQAPVQKRGV